jgi:hypothetical protein
MASCKLGYIYVVPTSLVRGPAPKTKFALCVCVAENYFVWINTNARLDGLDQLEIEAGCHQLITHTSHVDLSRIIMHREYELAQAKEFPCISDDVCRRIVERIEAGLDLMPQKYADIVLANLRSLLP